MAAAIARRFEMLRRQITSKSRKITPHDDPDAVEMQETSACVEMQETSARIEETVDDAPMADPSARGEVASSMYVGVRTESTHKHRRSHSPKLM